jgi:uncharacterized protein (DUF2141 family)
VAGIDISLEIEEIRSDTGEILISLFASGDGFPGDHKQAVQLSSVKASTNGVSVVFTNVVPGAYAVSVCHDENSDGQMNRKFYGPPKEGYGLYRKEKPRMGPPQFQDSVFDVGTSNLSLTVSLLYPED